MNLSSNNDDGLPVENADDAVLRMLGGANFSGNAKITLPSGKTIGADEAQAMTSLFHSNSNSRGG